MFRTRSQKILSYVLYAFATLQFMRFYVISTHFYLDMHAYMTGHERLPFQRRILPILLMWPIDHSPWLMHMVANRRNTLLDKTASTPQTLAFYLVSLLAFFIAGFFTVRLYRALTDSRLLEPLVYPLLIIIAMWTYVVHVDANFSYPYDMPAVAFFAAGLYFIYQRRFLPLLLVVLIGTFNRETTLFLIGIYGIDAASNPAADAFTPLRLRFRLSTVPWPRVFLLLGIWVAIKAALAHQFHANSRVEDYNRIVENFYRLKWRLLPALLNICGYLLPLVILFRRKLAPARFANYLYILPFWFAIMFYTGVIVETRIYGELCSYVAIATILILEKQLAVPAALTVAHGSGLHFRRRKTDLAFAESHQLAAD